MTDSRNQPRRHAAALALVAAGMFGFAYALVPLYEVFCELTGFNGRTFGQTTATAEAPSGSIGREVTIQFLAQVGRGMPWEFRPTESRMRVRIGEVSETRFYARNFAGHAVTGQAVPSVSPGFAATSLRKIECFCFTEQRLGGGRGGRDARALLRRRGAAVGCRHAEPVLRAVPGFRRPHRCGRRWGALMSHEDTADPVSEPPRYYVPHSSVWPIVGSVALFITAYGAGNYIQQSTDKVVTATGSSGAWIFFIGLAAIAFMMFGWFGTVIRESLRGW